MMKAITWLASVSVGVVAISSSTHARVPEGWGTDLEKGFKQAKAENKPLLLHFTGSDWCPPCIVMNKNVFSKKEFVSEASKKYVLVELDSPKSDPELEKKTLVYATKYNILGYPFVILFNPQGKEFSRFLATDYPTQEGFLQHLNAAYEKKDLE